MKTKTQENKAMTAKTLKTAKTIKTSGASGPAKTARGPLSGVLSAVGKVPAWLARLRSELRQLIDRLSKLDAAIDRLESVVVARRATWQQKETLKLMKRQRRAMGSYRAALEALAEQAAADTDGKL